MLRKSDSNQINDDAFSSREEDLLEAIEIDHKLLSHISFYNSTNLKEFVDEYLESNIIVGFIIERLINEGSKKLYDKYIGTKLPNHVLNHSREYLDILNNMEFQTHDQCDLGVETLDEDLEPFSYPQDSWVRSKINIERKPPNISEEIQKANNNVAEPEPSESKHSWIKSNASKLLNKSDIIKEAKKNEMKPVLLPEEIKTVFDPLEEQVRMKRERDMKLKEKNQEAKHKQEEIKEQQYKIKGMNNENSKKNYTYDYEGNIILFQNVKVDKLPPSNYTMIVDFSKNDQSSKEEDEKTKKGAKNQTKNVVLPPKPAAKPPQEQAKFIPSPTIFDVFNAIPGVTLIEGGRTKTYTGPKIEKSAFTIMNLSSNMNETNPIRISKNEYLQLTRGGNLSRSQNYSSSTTDKEKRQGKLFDDQAVKGNISKENLIQESHNLSNASDLKDLNFQMNKSKQKKKRNKENNIEIKSNKMLSSLVVEDDDTINLPKLLEKTEKNEEIFKTPVDEFNLQILRSKDWGKSSTSSGFLPALKGYSKPGNKEFEKTVGKKITNPRDRLKKIQVMEKEEHLGPPMIGKIAGHGINSSGFG